MRQRIGICATAGGDTPRHQAGKYIDAERKRHQNCRFWRCVDREPADIPADDPSDGYWFSRLHVAGTDSGAAFDPPDGYLFTGCDVVQVADRQAAIPFRQQLQPALPDHAQRPPPPRTFRPDIPEELDAIVRHAMQKDLSRRYQAWGEFTRDLVHFFSSNAEVQAEIFDTEKFDTLRSLHFFKNVRDTELWEVLRISDWHEVRKGEYILHEGDQGREFFILASGLLKVMKQGRVLDTLQSGDCFGEMKRFPDSNFLRTTAVLAETDATLIEINLDVLAKASVECRFQFDDAFLYVLLKRLDVANARISNLQDKRGS